MTDDVKDLDLGHKILVLEMKTRIVPEKEDAVFHVISRMAFHMLNMGDEEKKVLRGMLEKQATFSGMKVLSFCLLDNHFHLLIKVPYQPDISDEVLLKRYSALYTDADPRYTMMPDDLQALLKTGGTAVKEMREQLLARMGSISIFMKELKQRFCLWYNRKHENSGTIWAKRFDSILVENVKKTLQLIGAYIDLNAVRLQLCKTPQEYKFCTFGDAFNGNSTAREWLADVYHSKQWLSTLKRYRCLQEDCYESLYGGLLSLSGMNKGVIGSDDYVRKWSHYESGEGKTKRSIPSLLLKGILCVGVSLVSAPNTFRMYPQS